MFYTNFLKSLVRLPDVPTLPKVVNATEDSSYMVVFTHESHFVVIYYNQDKSK